MYKLRMLVCQTLELTTPTETEVVTDSEKKIKRETEKNFHDNNNRFHTLINE